jgi:hypothetical protein
VEGGGGVGAVSGEVIVVGSVGAMALVVGCVFENFDSSSLFDLCRCVLGKGEENGICLRGMCLVKDEP